MITVELGTPGPLHADIREAKTLAIKGETKTSMASAWTGDWSREGRIRSSHHLHRPLPRPRPLPRHLVLHLALGTVGRLRFDSTSSSESICKSLAASDSWDVGLDADWDVGLDTGLDTGWDITCNATFLPVVVSAAGDGCDQQRDGRGLKLYVWSSTEEGAFGLATSSTPSVHWPRIVINNHNLISFQILSIFKNYLCCLFLVLAGFFTFVILNKTPS